MGHADPDTGQGEAAESEVPEGVDALTDEQIQAAEERGGGGGDDDAGALDVSEAMGDADAEGTAADDAGDDAAEKTDADAQVAPDTGEDV
jgi:hypothetical protein